MAPGERKIFLSQIRGLEENLAELLAENRMLKEQLELQGEETFEMAGATMAIRAEDAERLAAFRKTNGELVQFVEAVAESRTKFRDEARRILGF